MFSCFRFLYESPPEIYLVVGGAYFIAGDPGRYMEKPTLLTLTNLKVVFLIDFLHGRRYAVIYACSVISTVYIYIPGTFQVVHLVLDTTSCTVLLLLLYCAAYCGTSGIQPGVQQYYETSTCLLCGIHGWSCPCALIISFMYVCIM